ncbi:acetate--CoA ligase family protein [Streptomyces sp. MRC013]|uniref:acetate--CoA ligase family protein n=1 Tax=Streptomyces sp. MRC013 TaxID=2898276 RepID=UPI002026122E|nr:acetate--CoA ligase family protein [Streptomyces sp. MRC013]URM90976.1 acetate--CoA ligase family protein [Streptomyces sp. MRC013]
MVLGSARGGFTGGPGPGGGAPDLGPLFRPRAVALLGAGGGRDAAVRWALGRGARVYAVRGAAEAGVRSVPSVSGLPDDVDLAVVLGDDPLPDVRQLAAREIPLAVVLGGSSSADRLRGGATRVLGPTDADLFAPLRDDLPGPGVAVVTPTGARGRHLYALQDVGVRVSYWAVTGAGADLTAADLLAYCAEQPGVGAVACHLDPVHDAPALFRAADHAARRGVPVVALATAAPATAPVLDAALRQYGVVPVGSPDQLQDTAVLLARARPPRADGIAVYDDGPDGAAAHVAALASAAGLPAAARPGAGLDALLADPAVGVVVCPVPAPRPPHTDRLARALADAAETTDKPVCVIWGSPAGTEAAYRETLLGSPRVVTFRTTGNCVAALAAYAGHHRRAAAYRSPFEGAPSPADPPSPAARRARPLLRPGRRLSEHAAKQLLRAYGVRVPREQLVTSAAAAVRAAAQVGYPVVLKASAPHLEYRAELGLVRVGLTSASQVRDTYRDLTEIARCDRLDLEGVLVCQMVERGVEMAVRLAHDPLLGPTVTVGAGGALAEVEADTAVRVPPFGEREARAALDGLRVRRLLDGVRGGAPLDVDALAETVLRVQRVALELGGELVELAADPLLVRERGQGAVALGARAVCRPDDGG